MKRKNQIQKIKDQINARIKCGTQSEKDYIVFRPRNTVINPILSKQNNNMTSIFELQNKRKNQAFLLKIRSPTKEQEQDKLDFKNHLHIQRCKTFKKYLNKKQKNKHCFHPFKILISNEAQIRKLNKTVSSLRDKQASENEIFFTNNLTSRMSKKKIFENVPLNFKVNINQKQKQGKLNQRKKLYDLTETIENSFLSAFSQNKRVRQIENQPSQLIRKSKIYHKRFQTQIPSILMRKMVQYQQKQNFAQRVHQKNTIYTFQPWQISETFEKNDQIFKD